jgi:hypothetical protein
MELMSKGLQHNLNHKAKDWFKRLALEAEMAMMLAKPEEQHLLRLILAKKTKGNK